MNDELKNSLWNLLNVYLWNKSGFTYDSRGRNIGELKDFSSKLWFHYFKEPIDDRPKHPHLIIGYIREYFFRVDWFEVYDILEFIFQIKKGPKMLRDLNSILERELAGYRFLKGKFVPVTDKQEIEALEIALSDGPYDGVQAHLNQALEHLSRRENPDYRNSIKESISALESMTRIITGKEKATLGDALNDLEKNGRLHPALKRSFSALYGYTSDEGGIRHAMLEKPDIGVNDAKYFLISCSAFINYLKTKT